MPKGYVIVTGTIHDPEGMKAYNRLASRTISEGGGKVLVVDTKPEVLEGDWHGSQTVGVPPTFRIADRIGSASERNRGVGTKIREIQARVP